MALPCTIYDRTRHAAVRTAEFLFNQLIPYIGNKRKLLKLIHQAVEQTAMAPGHASSISSPAAAWCRAWPSSSAIG